MHPSTLAALDRTFDDLGEAVTALRLAATFLATQPDHGLRVTQLLTAAHLADSVRDTINHEIRILVRTYPGH